MNSKAPKIDEILRIVCAVATSFGAAVFFLMFAALCVEAIRRRNFDAHELGLPIALAIIGLLAFFSAHIAWRLWRGSLSSNGLTLMPTWFIQMFGFFFLGGIAFVAYKTPTYPMLVEGVSVALTMIFFGKHVAKRKKESDHGG